MIELKRRISSKLRDDIKIAFEERLASLSIKEISLVKSNIIKHLECIKHSNQKWTRELYIHLKVLYAQVLLNSADIELLNSDIKKIYVALIYFIDHDDIIPDHVAGDGFLDDAILTNLTISKLTRAKRLEVEQMVKLARKGELSEG